MILDFSLNCTTLSNSETRRGEARSLDSNFPTWNSSFRKRSPMHARTGSAKERKRESEISRCTWRRRGGPFHSHKIVVTSTVPKGRLRKWPVLRQSSRLHAASYAVLKACAKPRSLQFLVPVINQSARSGQIFIFLIQLPDTYPTRSYNGLSVDL